MYNRYLVKNIRRFFSPQWYYIIGFCYVIGLAKFVYACATGSTWIKKECCVLRGCLLYLHSFVTVSPVNNIWRRGWDECYFVHVLGYFVERMIPSNILLFHVFTHVVFTAAMASPLLGAIGEFDPAETFTFYSERLDQFVVPNNTRSVPADASAAVVAAAEKKKVAVMISVIGKKTYSILRDLCSPANPKDKTFEQLCELLQQYFKPKRLEVAESCRFHR